MLDTPNFSRADGAGNVSPAALVAQLDRASDYGSEGWGFESLRARHIIAVQKAEADPSGSAFCLQGGIQGGTGVPQPMSSFDSGASEIFDDRPYLFQWQIGSDRFR